MKLFLLLISFHICLSSLNNHKFRESFKSRTHLLSSTSRKLSLIACTKYSPLDFTSLGDSLGSFLISNPTHAKDSVQIFSAFLSHHQATCLKNSGIFLGSTLPHLENIEKHLETTPINATLLQVAVQLIQTYIESQLNLTTFSNTSNSSTTTTTAPASPVGLGPGSPTTPTSSASSSSTSSSKNQTALAKTETNEITIGNVTIVYEVVKPVGNYTPNSTVQVNKTGNITYDKVAFEAFVANVLSSCYNVSQSTTLIIDIVSTFMENGALAFSVIAALIPALTTASSVSNVSFMDLLSYDSELSNYDETKTGTDEMGWIRDEIEKWF